MKPVTSHITDLSRRAKFLLRAVASGCLLLGLVACDSDSGFETGGEFTGQAAETVISGYYRLTAVNDTEVPGIITLRFSQTTIHHGDFTIRRDGSCSSTLEFSSPMSGRQTQVSHCEYEHSGETIEMQWLGAARNKGAVDGESLVVNNQGLTFAYQRVQPIGRLDRLDLTDECDPSRRGGETSRVGAGIVDDFSGDLVSGLNRKGLGIGFLTFQDSTITRIAMSTTVKHPPRPDEAVGNAVLQLDMDVRDWAGVIHAFENEPVTRWTPQDWRGLSELRFWFYGNGRQTPLFIEILDNRRPCPDAVGAEVFTHSFTDDFVGWRQIVVPFSAFQRKEIFNDAPSDGLTLSAVHGWALGSRDTGGPTTYYLDQVEVR